MLSKEHILNDLQTDLIGRKLFVFESIDSTNACAKTLAEAGSEEGTVVAADFQTSGRGRLGRAWLAEPNTNLLFSVLLRPPSQKHAAGLLTFYAAVSVARAVESATGLSVECKWPNDLLLSRKKFCGILLENSLEKDRLAYAVIGIGVNVNQRSFDRFLSSATSLSNELGKAVDRADLFKRILLELDAQYKSICAGQSERILSEWNSRCRMYGQEITVSQHNETISGTAVGLSDEGGLILRTPAGNKTIFAGDVTILN